MLAGPLTTLMSSPPTRSVPASGPLYAPQTGAGGIGGTEGGAAGDGSAGGIDGAGEGGDGGRGGGDGTSR